MLRRSLLVFLAFIATVALPSINANSATVLINNYLYNATSPWPGGVSGVTLWADASDISTITDAGSGAVSAWADKSGNTYTSTQGTSASRPITGVATINGRNAIRFDGINDFLNLSSGLYGIPNGDYTIYIANAKPVPNAGGLVYNFRDGGGNNAYYRNDFSDTVIQMISGTSTSNPFSYISDTNPHIFVLKKSGTTVQAWRDYKTGTTTTASNFTATGAVIGAEHGTFGFNRIDIGEILLYNRALTTPEDAAVRAYLANRWLPFLPTSIADLGTWYDSSQSGSISQSSGLVGTWYDLSNNGRNCTASSTARPTTNATTINGLNSVSFNGTANTMTCNIASLNASGPMTIIAVYKPATTGTGLALFYNNGTLGSTQNLSVRNQAQRIGTTTLTRPSVSSGSALVSISTIDAISTGAFQTLKIGTETELTNTTSWAGVATGLTLVQNTFPTEIAEIMVYHRVLSKAEKNSLGNYAATKWGVPWTDLP